MIVTEPRKIIIVSQLLTTASIREKDTDATTRGSIICGVLVEVGLGAAERPPV